MQTTSDIVNKMIEAGYSAKRIVGAVGTTPEFVYELRVNALEREGMTRGDAQGVVDAEDMQ